MTATEAAALDEKRLSALHGKQRSCTGCAPVFTLAAVLILAGAFLAS